MGVDRTDYLMLGVDVGVDAFDWEKHETEVDGVPGARFDVVYDGMCGKYCIAGKIIAVGDEYEGFETVKVEESALLVDKDALAAKISEAFGKPVSAQDLALLLFSHFS
jgi:hypothetical protein